MSHSAVGILRSSLALVVVVVGACRGATQTGVSVPPPPCSGTIPVQVASVAKPEISWTPGCGMTNVVVSRDAATSTEAPLWAFSVPENIRFGPKIVYGTAPRGATVWAGPQSLIVGGRYRVTVEYVVGGDAVAASGTTTFTLWLPD